MKKLLVAVLLVLAAAGSAVAMGSFRDAGKAPAPTAVAEPDTGQPRVVAASRGVVTDAQAQAGSLAASAAVTAIGDSVMLAAAADLRGAIADITIDAEVGRQVPAALDILRGRRAAGTLTPVVVIHMGTNGAFTVRQFDEMMVLLAGVRKVVFVNVKAPLTWEAPDNEMLAAAVKRYPQVVLVDWHAAGTGRPELFWDDGVHLRPEGARVYAALVAAAISAP